MLYLLLLVAVPLAVSGQSTIDPGAPVPPVVVELYYESLCPGCRAFITSQLLAAFKFFEHTTVFRIGMYPYGNAHETQMPDGSWNYTCQHGAPECTGNFIEACIIKYTTWSEDKYLPVLECMESAEDPIKAAQGCVESKSDLKYATIDKCAKGTEGNQLMHWLAKKTGSLNPPHQYVPWVVVNGVHNETIQTSAMKNLSKLVCDLYQGSPPAKCTEQKDYFDAVDPLIKLLV